MHAADDGVGLEHELVARRRRQHRRVVDQSERAGMPRERLEMARDQPVLAGRARSGVLAHGHQPVARVELARAQLPRELVEHRVDHAGLVAVDEGMGDIDILRHDHARRHVALAVELVGARAQDRAQHGLDALERPALRQRRVDHRIELALLGHHAADDVAEERGLRRQIFIALDLAADPMALELRQDVVQRGRRRDPSGRAPAPRQAARRRGGWRGVRRSVRPLWPWRYRLARWRLIATSASAARAASPPLSCSVDARARPGLRLVVDGEDAVAARQPVRDREVDQRARRLHRHDVEMERLALDHAAERHHAVVGLLLLFGRVDRDRDGRHDLERARHRDDVPGAPWPRRAPWRRRRAARRRCRCRTAPRPRGCVRPRASAALLAAFVSVRP